MIKVSKTAAEKIKEAIAKAENPGNTMLRISFSGYG